MSRSFVLFAVGLPLLALASVVARSELRVRASEEWMFPVSGYDPRDLLRGHYIRYRIDLQEESPTLRCSNDDPACCLCLTRRDDGTTSTRRTTCTDARDACDGRLQTRHLEGLERLYVPESEALAIERRLRAAAPDEARIVLAIDGLGRPMVRELRIDDGEGAEVR